MSRDKQIDIDIAVEEMASAVRERTVACNKCEYYKEGSCLKPVDLGCNDNEDILNLCDAIYENGYRKADEVAREIFEDCHNTLIKILGAVRDGLDKAIREDNEEAKLVHIGTEETVKCIILIFAELKKKYTEEGK